MKILELFSGTESFSKVARSRGHETFTVDNAVRFVPDLHIDIMEMEADMVPFKPDVIWASPPCQKFSVMNIAKNWNHDGTPKNEEAKKAVDLVKKAAALILELQPAFYFIENPRAKLRTLGVVPGVRFTVTYCQYGDSRMKPTDIWHNCVPYWLPKPPCKNGALCHDRAPRGSKTTGTQGLLDPGSRGAIPPALCLEIVKACEEGIYHMEARL